MGLNVVDQIFGYYASMSYRFSYYIPATQLLCGKLGQINMTHTLYTNNIHYIHTYSHTHTLHKYHYTHTYSHTHTLYTNNTNYTHTISL